MRSFNRRWIFPILACTLLGCRQEGNPSAAPPPVVTVSEPVEREVIDHAYFTGRIAAVESVEVRARVSGYLQEIAFTPGSEVKEGQLLMQIEPTVFKAAAEKAKADVAQYAAQEKLAASEAQRSRRLLSSRSIAVEDYEKAQAQLEQSTAALAAGKAALKTAQQNLDWTKVLSPIDGKTGVNLLTKGNLVVADQTLLTTVVSEDPIYCYFNVDERTMLRVQKLIRKGQATSYQKAAYPLDVGVANETGFPHHGTIDFVANQVSTGTGTLNVRGKFRNPERILTSGLFARVRLPIGKKHPALLVSDRALGNDQGEAYLLVVDDNKEVVRRNVEVGALHDGGLREIRSGLKAGELVIVEGLLRVRPGIAVNPKKQLMPVHAIKKNP